MYCRKCGSEVRDGIAFCPKCGNPLEVKTMAGSPGMAAEGLPDTRVPRDIEKSPANNKKLLIIGACILVALLIAGLVTFFFLNKNKGDEAKGEETLTEQQSGVDENTNDENRSQRLERNDSNTESNTSVNDSSADSNSKFTVGATYYTQDVVRVREEPSKKSRQIMRMELDPEDYEHSMNYNKGEDDEASLKKGSPVVCLGMSDDDLWMKIASGWICVYDEGQELVK